MSKLQIRIRVAKHKDTGLLMAMSDDLYGLTIHARTAEEIRSQLAGAIRELLEAQGHTVISVTAENDDRFTGADVPAFVANAALAAAHA